MTQSNALGVAFSLHNARNQSKSPDSEEGILENVTKFEGQTHGKARKSKGKDRENQAKPRFFVFTGPAVAVYPRRRHWRQEVAETDA
jgi:ribosomal protein L39E